MFQYLQNSREDPSPSNSEQNVWTYTILAPPLWNLLLLLFSGFTGGLGCNFGSESGTSCCTFFLLIIVSSFGFRPSLFVFVSWNCMCCKLSANFIQMKYFSSTYAMLTCWWTSGNVSTTGSSRGWSWSRGAMTVVVMDTSGPEETLSSWQTNWWIKSQFSISCLMIGWVNISDRISVSVSSCFNYGTYIFMLTDLKQSQYLQSSWCW